MAYTACPACIKEPNTHSFTEFGSKDGTKLFYTAPARSNPSETCEVRLANFKHHLDQTKGSPWIWIFDFADMESKHHTSIKFTTGLAKLLIEEHETNLKEILLVRMNPWAMFILNMLKTLFTSPIFSRIRFIDGETLELYMNLKKEFQGKPLLWLGKTVMLGPEKELPVV
jgi:hypothetical protein